MAVYDPMDLQSRSQAFYLEFFNHYYHHGEPWFIKDPSNHYVDANCAFLDLINPPSGSCIRGMTDIELLRLPLNFHLQYSEYISYVVTNNDMLSLFISGVYKDKDVDAFIISLKPMLIDNRVMCMGVLNNLSILTLREKFLSAIGIESLEAISDRFPLSYYEDKSPYYFVTNKEWVAAWFLLVGKTYRWIANHLRLRDNQVDRRLANFYMKIGVRNRDEFFAVAIKNDWIKYIPTASEDGPLITLL